jgi:hypothetical protein
MEFQLFILDQKRLDNDHPHPNHHKSKMDMYNSWMWLKNDRKVTFVESKKCQNNEQHEPIAEIVVNIV